MEVLRGANGGGYKVLADLREFDGRGQATVAPTNGWDAQGNVLLAAGVQTWFPTSTTGGAAPAPVDTGYLDVAGVCHRNVVGGGAGGRSLRVAPTWAIPLWQDPALWPAGDTARKRWTFSCVTEVVGVPTNTYHLVGLTNGAQTIDGVQSGVDLAYDFGVARWRVRSKLTPLGGLTLGNISDFTTGQRIKVAFRYTESAAPTLEVLVNNAVLQTFTGVAALPSPAVALPAAPAGNATTFAAIFGATSSAVAVADAEQRTRRARFLLEQIIP